jgi:hypothetical protein
VRGTRATRRRPDGRLLAVWGRRLTGEGDARVLLLRVGWRTVGEIITRVVADQLDECHLEGLVCIGVDEISWLALAQESRR